MNKYFSSFVDISIIVSAFALLILVLVSITTDLTVNLQDNNGKEILYCPGNLTMRLTLLDASKTYVQTSKGSCSIGFGGLGRRRDRYQIEVFLMAEPGGLTQDAILYDGEVMVERRIKSMNIRLPNVSQRVYFEYLGKGQKITPNNGQQVFVKPLSPEG